MTKIEKFIRRASIIAGYEIFSRVFDKLIRVDMVEEEFADILKQCKHVYKGEVILAEDLMKMKI